MGAIIGPASGIKRPIFTLFSTVARAITEVAQIIFNIPQGHTIAIHVRLMRLMYILRKISRKTLIF